jgi:hypothetical protein
MPISSAAVKKSVVMPSARIWSTVQAPAWTAHRAPSIVAACRLVAIHCSASPRQ